MGVMLAITIASCAETKPGSTGSGGFDADGVQMMFPIRHGGVSWSLRDHDPNTDDNTYDNYHGTTFTQMNENGVSFWRSGGSGVTYADGSPPGRTHRLMPYPSGCKNKPQLYWWSNGAAEHGYTCTPQDLRDQEVTVYFRVSGDTNPHKGLSIGVRGGHHNAGPGAVSPEYSSIVKFSEAGVCKEYVHPTYKCHNAGAKYSYDTLRVPDKWIGFKVVTYNLPDDKSTKNLVYVDRNPYDALGKPANNWELNYEWTDTGQLWSPAATWGGMLDMFRYDGFANVDIAMFTIRSIGAP